MNAKIRITPNGKHDHREGVVRWIAEHTKAAQFVDETWASCNYAEMLRLARGLRNVLVGAHLNIRKAGNPYGFAEGFTLSGFGFILEAVKGVANA